MRQTDLHSKLHLVQQLKQLSKQHELVLAAYERKVEAKLAEVAHYGAGSSGKRVGAPLIAEGPEAKRQRMMMERDRRKKELWDEIIRIVEKIRKNPKSDPFRVPVDPVKLKIPDYPNIIRNPMDISTVLKKLRSNPRQYSNPVEVANDMRQIWINSRTYNGLQHPVTLSANVLSENFEKAWGQANIEQKWQVELRREEREEQSLAEEGGAGDDDLVTQMRSKRNMLGDLIAAKDVQEGAPPGALGGLQPDRDMTFEEKRKLSAHLASVPGEKLSAVLDIIEECEDLPSDDGQEREIDMDQLNNGTLWKLKAYVDGVLTATAGPPPKKTTANRASTGGAPNKVGAGQPATAAPVAAAAPAAATAFAVPAPVPAAAAAAAGAPAAGAAVPAAEIKQEPPAAAGQQQQGAAAGAPAAAAADAAANQQQPLPPPPPQQIPQQQQPQAQQQQQPNSPQHSGGNSAGEVVASTAGGAGTRAVTMMHTLDNTCTVAQSGTNARPSAFVKSKPRLPVPAGPTPSNPNQPTNMDVDVNDDWAALTKGSDAAADAPAGAAADAAAADAVKQEGAAADAAAGGDAGDMWDDFAEKAKQEEEKLQKQKEEEEQRKWEEEEQRRKLEELERQKELEEQQQQDEKKQQAAEELHAAGAPAGAAAENKAVLQEMDKLMDDAADGGDIQVDADADDDQAEQEEGEENTAAAEEGFD